jgi:hypothetical protein
MKNYGYINKETGLVENLVNWDGVSEYVPEETHFLIEIPPVELGPNGEKPPIEKCFCIGSYFIGGEFVNKTN